MTTETTSEGTAPIRQTYPFQTEARQLLDLMIHSSTRTRRSSCAS
jgi:hypothetical protein